MAEKNKLLVIALSDYDPHKNDIPAREEAIQTAPDASVQLSFKCCEKFEVAGGDLNWWLFVKSLKTAKQGYIPSTSVAPIKDSLTAQEEFELEHGRELSPHLVNTNVDLKLFPGAPREKDVLNRKPCPEDSANIFSKLTFWWLNWLVWTGYKRPLKDEDLWALNKKNKASHMVPRIDKKYTEEQKKFKQKSLVERQTEPSEDETTKLKEEEQAEQDEEKVAFEPKDKEAKPQKKPSLVKVVVKEFAGSLVLMVMTHFVYDILQFVQPQILKLLIEYTEDSSVVQWNGYVYAAAMAVAAFTQSVFLHQYFHLALTIGMRIRTCILGLVYKKALLLSNASRKLSTAGEMVNLMSVDAQRLMDLMSYVNLIWATLFQTALALYFLFNTMGISVLAGFGVMVLLVPVNFVVSKVQRKLQVKQMAEKDERIKMMNEILGGMKVLKLYAWEESFMKKVTGIRDKELQHLRNAAYLNASFNFTFTCAPFLVSLATFAIYVYTGNELTAAKAFVALSLFNILRFPITMFPNVIVALVQAQVSIKRLTDFLNLEELDPANVKTTMPDHISAQVVHIEDGTFNWDKTDKPVLKSINLNINRGSLVAVVGQVGCGKTTLLSALLGETETLGGQVYVKGSVAYVAQQAWIQNATLRDNILFGRMFMAKRYCKVINACALRTDLDILAAGDQTEIGERGINLSGGQKQRVSLARAVYYDADVYLLDDPLSAVDSHVGKHIFDKVIGPRGVLRKKTRILVTHGISFLPQADQIVVLQDGRISEVGTYQELLDNRGAFSEFLKTYEFEKVEVPLIEVPELELEQAGSTNSLEQLDEPEVRDLEQLDDHQLDGHMEEMDAPPPKLVRLVSSVTADTRSIDTQGIPRRGRADSVFTLDTLATTELCDCEFMDDKEVQKVIEEERSQTGRVKMSVFLTYAKSIGIFFTIFMVLFLIIAEVSMIGSRLWLAEWSAANVTSSGERDMFLGVYGGLGLSQSVFVLLSSLAMAFATMKASRNIHKDMLVNVMHSPMSFFETTPLGRIVNRFSKDINVVDNTIPRSMLMFLRTFLSVVGTICAITYATPIFLAVIVFLGILYVVIQRVYVAVSRQLKRIESVSRSPIYNFFFETISGASTIRAFWLQNHFIRENYYKIDENQVAYYPSIASNRWLAMRLEFLGNLIIFFAALFAVISRGNIAAGLVGLSLTYAMQITQTLNMMVRQTSELEANIVSVERAKEYAEVSTEAAWIVPDNRPPDDWPHEGKIQIDAYDLRYRDELPLVLKNIDCVFNPGEKIGIVGRTGAGKSSLTLALFRILESAGGTVIIDGVDISKIGLQDLRSRLTIIPQDPVLFSGTLRLNLDPFDRYSDEEIWKVLEVSHLKTFVTSLENGLQHPVAEGGDNLSVGQRQLVCLARALLRKSKILVLDEATAAVDLETDEFIQETIRKEFADRTVLTIAHRLNTIMDYSRILVLDKGFIAEFDTPINLLAQRGIFYSMAHDAGLA